ncbi:MAG: metallopeptidase family protein [Actinobacteria bacterium]|nr:metallopeptidase family protein [Actinomycetota bacterium]
MDREEFEAAILKIIDGIPEKFKSKVDNLSIVIDEMNISHSDDKNKNNRNRITLALYHGVPLTKRTGCKPTFPDKITIYKKAIEMFCKNDEEIKKTLKRVVLHELGHYFGLAEDKLNQLGY